MEIAFELQGSHSGGTSKVIGSWVADETLSAYQKMVADTSLTVDRGPWDFTLTVRRGDAVLATATTTLNVKGGTVNKLNFGSMSYNGQDAGGVFIILNWSAEERANKTEAGLYRLDTGELVGSKEIAGGGSEIVASILYRANDVPVGTYRFKAQIYQGDTVIGTYSELVQVAGNLTSAAERELGALNSLYTITLDWGGKGELAEGQTFPETYNRYQTVTLPTAEQVVSQNYALHGWYKDGDDKNALVSQITSLDQDATYHARWVQAAVKTAAGEETYYDTFDEALTAAQASAESTLTLLADISRSSYILIGSTFTLDLNGRNLDISNAYSGYGEGINVGNPCHFTLTDGSEGGDGTITVNSTDERVVGVLVYAGTFTMKGGTLCAVRKEGITYAGYEYGIWNYYTGTVRIEGGTILTILTTSRISSINYGIANENTGRIEIAGGSIRPGDNKLNSYASAGVYNKAGGTIVISGGTIDGASSGSNSYGVYNYGAGTVEITGGTITGGKTGSAASAGVMNYAGGTVTISGTPTITGGSAEAASSYGVWNYGYNSSFGKINVSGSPSIAGGTVGAGNVSAAFAVNYVDTCVITVEAGFAPAAGKPYSVYSAAGIFAKPGEGVTLNEDWFTSYDETVMAVTKDGAGNLVLEAVVALSDVATVIKDGAAVGTYTDMAAALAAAMASDGSTLQLLRNVSLSDTLDVSSGSFTLDLNGKVLFSTATNVVTLGAATLVIDDTSTEKTGIIAGKSTESATKSLVLIDNAAALLTIRGGTFRVISTNIAVYNRSDNSVVDIVGGTIICGVDSFGGVFNYGTGTVNISGTATITGSATNDYGYGVRNYGAGTVNISGSATITTGGASANSSSCGVYNKSTGTVTISGTATIAGGASANSSSYGVYNESTGVVTISGTATITGGASANNNSYGVYNYGTGTVNISGSPAISGGTAANGVSAAFGVAKPGDGAITLASDFQPPATPLYVVVGTTANPKGIFAKPGSGATLEESWFAFQDQRYVVQKDESGNLVKADAVFLTLEAQDGNLLGSYAVVDEALAAAMTNEGSILKLTRDIALNTTLNVTSGNFTLDLNGNTLTTSVTYAVTLGAATLVIDDSSTEQDGTISQKKNGCDDQTGVYLDSADAHFTMKGGIITIENVDDYSYGVWNKGSGTVLIEGGTIQWYKRGVSNASGGSVTITGGTIKNGGTYRKYNYGVYNAGTMTITGGVIQAGTESDDYNNKYSCGLVNSGTVVISGGTIRGAEQYYSYGIENTVSGIAKLSGSPAIWGRTADFAIASKGNEDSGVLTLEQDFAPADKYTVHVYDNSSSALMHTNVTGAKFLAIFAKAEDGGTLNTDWFTPTSGYGSDFSIGFDKSNTKLRIQGPVSTTLVASNGSQIDSYDYLPYALEDAMANENSTLRLEKNLSLDDSYLKVTQGNFTLDLNGKELKTYAWSAVELGAATLVIDDTSTEKTGTILGVANGNLYNGVGVYCTSPDSKLTVKGGTIEAYGARGKGGYTAGVYANDGGIVRIEGGTVIGGDAGTALIYNEEDKKYTYSYGVYMAVGDSNQQGEVVVTGGTIKGGYAYGRAFGVFNYKSNIYIQGGTIYGGWTNSEGYCIGVYINCIESNVNSISGNPVIKGLDPTVTSDRPTVDATFGLCAGSYRFEKDWVVPTTYQRVYYGYPFDDNLTGVFAKPGDGATLDASRFTTPVSGYKVVKSGNNLEIQSQ